MSEWKLLVYENYNYFDDYYFLFTVSLKCCKALQVHTGTTKPANRWWKVPGQLKGLNARLLKFKIKAG